MCLSEDLLLISCCQISSMVLFIEVFINFLNSFFGGKIDGKLYTCKNASNKHKPAFIFYVLHH